jgi:DNA mismatch repair protein MutH
MTLHEAPPASEMELLLRCKRVEGLTIGQLAARLSVKVPDHPIYCKGIVGTLMERALGTSAGNQALPDFPHLNIELKTLPIGVLNKPVESTFITTIPLLTIHQQQWNTSSCFIKLKRILWVPIEYDSSIAFRHRRFGEAFLWSPAHEDQIILEQDWVLLSTMIGTGQLTEVDARMGQYLQVRPKAMHGNALSSGFDQNGNKIKTLPRGFYLRSRYTEVIWKNKGLPHQISA